MIRELQISALTVDQTIQCRDHTDEATIADYASDLAAGAAFPPVEVVQDGDALLLVDGFHRVEAARRIKRPTIQANVVDGTRQDAAWAACCANRAHGLRRTTADKQRAVQTALCLRPDESDRAIADHCGVSAKTVSAARKRLTVEIPQSAHATTMRTGRDGRKIDTTRIGRARTPRPAPIRRTRVSGSEPDDSPRYLSYCAIAKLQDIDPTDPVGAEELRRVRAWIDRILGDIDAQKSGPQE